MLQHPSVFLLLLIIKHLRENSLFSVFPFSHHHSLLTFLQFSCSSHFSKEMFLTFTGNSLIPNPVVFGSVLLSLVFPVESGTIVLLFSPNLLGSLSCNDHAQFSPLYISDPFVHSFTAYPSFSPRTIFPRLLLCLFLPSFIWS